MYQTQMDLYDQLLDYAKMNNIRLSDRLSTRSCKKLDSFKLKVNDLKSLLNNIKNNNKKIIMYRDQLINNASITKQKQINKKMRDLTDNNTSIVNQIHNLISQIDQEIQKQKSINPNQPETLSKIYQKKYLISEIQDILKQSQKIQTIVQKWAVGETVKRIQMMDNTISESQANKIAKQQKGFEKLMMQKTMGQGSQKLKYRINDILQKNQDIQQLEKSVKQNLILMQQIALLVSQQGEMIDNIQQNLEKAQDYIQKTTQNLKVQKKQQSKSRKKMCCIVLIVIIILALITVPIVLKQINASKTTTT